MFILHAKSSESFEQMVVKQSRGLWYACSIVYVVLTECRLTVKEITQDLFVPHLKISFKYFRIFFEKYLYTWVIRGLS